MAQDKLAHIPNSVGVVCHTDTGVSTSTYVPKPHNGPALTL